MSHATETISSVPFACFYERARDRRDFDPSAELCRRRDSRETVRVAYTAEIRKRRRRLGVFTALLVTTERSAFPVKTSKTDDGADHRAGTGSNTELLRIKSPFGIPLYERYTQRFFFFFFRFDAVMYHTQNVELSSCTFLFLFRLL